MLMPHNETVYAELEETLKKTDRAIVIMGTGVGKTYVTKEYLDNHDLNALVISPRTDINISWKNATSRVKTMTYQKFSRCYKSISYSDYDLIIADEVHHIGAETWGKPFRYVLDNHLCKVIGLTENSVRYTDGCKDVADIFFNNEICYGESVSSAITKKILNPVTYVGAIYNPSDLVNSVKSTKTSQTLIAKLDLAINNIPAVRDIIKSNMPEGKRKGFIFSSSINDVKEIVNFIHSIYPSMEIRSVHSKQASSINKANMEWFDTVDEGFLCSVNMLSEGLHLKGVNTLFMLRRTTSPSIFAQQLGRCLSASSKEPAILFDLVNNKYSLGKVAARVSTYNKADIMNLLSAGNNPMLSDQIIIKDYTSAIVDVLNDINNSLLPSTWTDEEDKLLRQYYPVEGMSCAKRFPDKKPLSVKWRAESLGIPNNRYIRWTPEQDEIITKYYPVEGMKGVMKRLGGDIKPTQIASRAYILKVKGNDERAWDDDETEIIRKYYPTEGTEVYLRLPGRTKSSCQCKARKMGIRTQKPVCIDDLSSDDIDTIKEYYPVEGDKCLSRCSAPISGALLKKVRREYHLVYHKDPAHWTDEEIEILRKYYPLEGVAIAPRLPNRKLKNILTQAKHLKIKRRTRSA